MTQQTTRQIPDAPDLYDAKGSCELCSGSIVKHRIHPANFASHAREHKRQGDPVELWYPAGIYQGSDPPTVFKIVLPEGGAAQ